jgi:hypothetical protein
VRAVAGVAAIAVAVTGCGDDGEASSAGEVGDVAAFCAAVEDLESTDADPTVEQIEAIRAAAPAAIREDAEFVADRFVDAIESDDLAAFYNDPEVGERLASTIEPFQEANCPNLTGSDGSDGESAAGAAGAVDPAFADYCAAIAELDAQEEFPTNEQLGELIELAPDDIAADVELAARAFIERGEAAFEDPAVGEAFDRIDEFESRECTPGEQIDDLAASDEAEPDAQQVAVRAVEYAFDFEPPSAGRTSFTLTNEGEEPHFMYVARLADGVTLEEAAEAEGEGGTIAAEADSDVAPPGEQAVLTVDLEPGDYVMLCFVTSPDGESHDELGMTVPFTVS